MNGWTPPISNTTKARAILSRLAKVIPGDQKMAEITAYVDEGSVSDTFIRNLDFITRELEKNNQARYIPTTVEADTDARDDANDEAAAMRNNP